MTRYSPWMEVGNPTQVRVMRLGRRDEVLSFVASSSEVGECRARNTSFAVKRFYSLVVKRRSSTTIRIDVFLDDRTFLD